MPHIVRKNPIVFGGGQRSFGVTRGQILKTLFTRYLKLGSLDRFHTYYVDALWCEEEPYCFSWGSDVTWDHRGQTLQTLLTQSLEVGSLDEFHTLVCMHYG